ncbi:MAG: GDP-mannose 4,6-dehydratase [Blastocatellia bacterium]
MNFWNRRNVFVTGATGLLGSWMTEELLNRGANVTCLIRDWVPESRLVNSGAVARINAVRGELEDYKLLARALNEYEIDSIFHLGAQTIVGTALRAPLSTFEANIRGTWNLMEACRVNSKLVERVVVASSDKAYGEQEQLPYTEDAALNSKYPYDVSKSCSEFIALSYFHTYQTPVAITRCGNLYGGGDLNFNRLIPGTIRSVLRDEAPIIRSDGQFIRDYFYVRDAVEAYLTLAERLPDERFKGEAFNFSTETPASVLELVDQILKLTGKTHLVPKVMNEASREIPKQYLSCDKAKKLLNWQSGYALDEGLRATIDWYEQALNSERR